MASESPLAHQATSSTSSEDPITSPRSTSLAAAATINAGTQAQEGRHSSSARGAGSPSFRRTLTGERRRSNVAMNLNLNDPALPAPGEMQTTGENGHTSRPFRTSSPQTLNRSGSSADPPPRHRAPSIGELHQELEQEQEAQVNRLLQTIRIQQSQIAALQAQTGTPAPTDSPTSERSLSFSTAASNTRTRSPAPPLANRSRRPSQASPALPRGLPAGPAPSHAIPLADESAIAPSGAATPHGGGGGGNRDETAFYQAEAQALTRENQLLKTRIKDLERQLAHGQGEGQGQGHGDSSHSAGTAPHTVRSAAAAKVVPDGAPDRTKEEEKMDTE